MARARKRAHNFSSLCRSFAAYAISHAMTIAVSVTATIRSGTLRAYFTAVPLRKGTPRLLGARWPPGTAACPQKRARPLSRPSMRIPGARPTSPAFLWSRQQRTILSTCFLTSLSVHICRARVGKCSTATEQDGRRLTLQLGRFRLQAVGTLCTLSAPERSSRARRRRPAGLSHVLLVEMRLHA